MSTIKFNSTSMIVIAGSFAKDPEMRYTPSGDAVATSSIPVNTSYKDKNSGEYVKKTQWYRVTVWKEAAEIFNKWCKKGTVVTVTGTLDFDPSTGGPKTFQKQDGTTSASFDIKAAEITILSGTRNKDEAGNAAPTVIPNDTAEPDDLDIPF